MSFCFEICLKLVWLFVVDEWCSFCIIEGPETVQDFAKMELQEIQDNIRSRRNKIFLHMEEVSGITLSFLVILIKSVFMSVFWFSLNGLQFL